MKLKFLFSLVALVAVIYLLNNKLGKLPALGKLFDPYAGFWQNGEVEKDVFIGGLVVLEGLEAEADVFFDERQVPHIFASNTHDLYFLQGYVTAYHRLWQMEFQTMAAAGRISELIGPQALEFDKEQRRIGMLYAAERSVEAFGQDPLTKSVMEAYADGVNAYISSLEDKDLPVEYKLMGYKPEPWTPLKSALLLKFMAKNLTYRENDFENTNAYKLLGKENFRLLYPEYPDDLDPIIPPSVEYDDAAVKLDSFHADLGFLLKRSEYDEPEKGIGSNNWAVSGRRTKTGYPILCNDPHLSLSLPSIWYEIQMSAPDVNVYGVSLPGSPNVIIGFNDSIAWGVTNAGRDVKDWYSIEFKDATCDEYKFEDFWLPTNKRIEEIKVKGSETVYDTVIYTHHGPVVYRQESKSGTEGLNLALKWTAHGTSHYYERIEGEKGLKPIMTEKIEVGNELLTFYNLNRSKNYEDYKTAIANYSCPGQNFVFASHANDVAIWQQGDFPARWPEQGRFIMDGSKVKNEWQARIPQEHNAHVLNPERGFVSSANQHPTDSTYPYYYTGVFEYYRNRRINDELRRMSSVSVEDMQQLQLDNYNMTAADFLPVLLTYLDSMVFENPEYENRAVEALKAWDYMNNPDEYAPTIFEIWMEELQFFMWDELSLDTLDPEWYYGNWWDKENTEIRKPALNNGKFDVDYPEPPVLLKLLKTQPYHQLFDHKSTPDIKEAAKNVVYDSFYWAVMKFYDLDKYQLRPLEWGKFKATGVRHLARINPFSVLNIDVGGNRHIVNAMTPTNGPSWRMVVSLGPELKAYGIYPGGQSGNPGSKYYDNAVAKWAAGEYYELHFMHDIKEVSIGIMKFKPKP